MTGYDRLLNAAPQPRPLRHNIIAAHYPTAARKHTLIVRNNSTPIADERRKIFRPPPMTRPCRNTTTSTHKTQPNALFENLNIPHLIRSPSDTMPITNSSLIARKTKLKYYPSTKIPTMTEPPGPSRPKRLATQGFVTYPGTKTQERTTLLKTLRSLIENDRHPLRQ